MAYIKIHPEKAVPGSDVASICPFGAIEVKGKEISINAGCKMCRMCVRKGGGVFEYVEDDARPKVDKSKWVGVTVVAEIEDGKVHPVSLELLGKAKELASVIRHPVYALAVGYGTDCAVQELLKAGADEVFVYDDPALEYFRIEPYANAVSDFIEKHHPCAMLVGGTVNGRSLAPRVAARFHTGLTADCTVLGMSETTDLDQIRPAYGGNIMAHINTPNHRPQFATVRYKIFSIPAPCEAKGKVTRCTLPPEKLASAIEILDRIAKAQEKGIEESEILVVAGRGIKKKEDLAMLEELAGLLKGRLASTRALVEAGWTDPKIQIGLSGRTVKPKLIITCGVSGAIQFVAGMNHSEYIVAINTDPEAPIFKVAHVRIAGDLYTVVPELIARIKAKGN